MTWTFDSSLLTTASAVTANLMKVRIFIGDTDTTRQQLDNETVFWLLSGGKAMSLTAADACDLLASKYAFQVNTENSALRVSAAARHEHYQKLADRLRKAGPSDVPGGAGDGVQLATMYVGGAVQADVDTLAESDVNVQPPFAVGQDDFPGTESLNDFTQD